MTVNIHSTILDEIVVVYDMDDVLWDYCGTVARLVDIDLKDWTDFHIESIPELSPAKRKHLREMIGRTDFYDQIEFFPGAEDILRPCELSDRVRVEINSNSISDRATDIKTGRLFEMIPGLRAKNLIFGIVQNGNVRTTLRKQFNPKSYIVIDDSPYNIASSFAPHNILPEKPWNLSPSGKRVLAQCKQATYYVPSLIQINAMVYDLVEQKLRQAP